MIIYVSKYIVEIYNLEYKVEIFANDNIRYRNKRRIIQNIESLK